jgi:hypothetical protein
LQDLTATGSKQWGTWWDGRGLLKVKIYDFAIYTNVQQLAHACPHTPRATAPILPPAAGANNADATTPPPRLRLRRLRMHRADTAGACAGICKDVGGNLAVEMSLCVRPARDLPLTIMRSEYKRILQKRLKALGGNPEDPSLHSLMAYFDPALLPATATRGGCIRKGTVLNFSRSRRGSLSVDVEGMALTTVDSRKLCEAVFDLYLGDAPVCRKARAAASDSLQAMRSQPLTLSI